MDSIESLIQLDNPTYLNDLIKQYLDNKIHIVIVSCQNKIKSNNPKYPKRNGRFIFNKETHLVLTHTKGYYLLLVKQGNVLEKAKIVSANDIGEREQVAWREFFDN